jgi:hypothetical protein
MKAQHNGERIIMSENLPAEWNQGAEEEIETVDIRKKSDLLAVPFLITSIRISAGDFGELFSITAEDATGDQFIVNDGGTGIARQLANWLAKHRDRSDPSQLGTWDLRLICRKGLRASTYPNPHGEGVSTTYYIA